MGRRLRFAIAAVAGAAVLVVAGGLVTPSASAPAPSGLTSEARREDGARQAPGPARAEASAISRAQQRLHDVPGDWRTWAALGSAYLERGRVTADPTYYPKAEGAARESLRLRPDGNGDALVTLGALAAARHDFTAARDTALAAIAVDGYDADAHGVLADARTQLGDAAGATAAVQRMLDLRPGLPAYARASYDLEQRGRVTDAADLMRRALGSAVDPHDVAFCRTQLGDLAWNAGDRDGARREYDAALAADPSTVAALRGRARVAGSLNDYGELVRRSPTPGYLLEYADLLRVQGRGAEAADQLRLAGVAQQLFSANGGTDGLTASSLAVATGDVAGALREAQGEWNRRQHADVADALGWALHLAGRDAEALDYARRAAGTGARYASYAYHLGAIELALGDRSAARTHLSQALATNPTFSPLDAPAARQLLTEVGP